MRMRINFRNYDTTSPPQQWLNTCSFFIERNVDKKITTFVKFKTLQPHIPDALKPYS